MNLILDTHIFVWYVYQDSKLPSRYVQAIEDPMNRIFVSVVAVWEVVIKHQLGQFPLVSDPAIELPRWRVVHGFTGLVVDEGAMPHLAQLPRHHKDPFDRLLIAQTLQHGLTMVTVDRIMSSYPIPLLPENRD